MSEAEETTATEEPEVLPSGVQLREHVYDGIQEYDQKLPNWWLWTFYIAIIVFVGYWFLYYQAGMFKTDGERINEKMAAIAAVKAKQLEELMGEISDDVLWKMSANSQIVAEGREIYNNKCFTCHSKDLGGSNSGAQYLGLPLNDAEWKYGGKPMEVLSVVMDGSPDKTKGMVAWKADIGPNNVAKVVAYIMSHHKAPPAEEKPPEE